MKILNYKKIPKALIGFILFLIVFIIYITITSGTGFKGKTLWDWLQLLIIPFVLAICVPWFDWTLKQRGEKNAELQKEREAAAHKERAETERSISKDNQQEKALQEYLDKISELLLEKHLRDSESGDEVRSIARTRTLTLLRRLDGERKGQVITFLSEAHLIYKESDKDKSIHPIINVYFANLDGAELSWADLRRTDLCGVDLHEADLFGIDLREADLIGANLSGANLLRAKLSNTNLRGAHLDGAKLLDSNLLGTNLSRATLVGTDLTLANLSGANIRETDLSRTILKSIIYDDKTIWPEGFTPPLSRKEAKK